MNAEHWFPGPDVRYLHMHLTRQVPYMYRPGSSVVGDDARSPSLQVSVFLYFSDCLFLSVFFKFKVPVIIILYEYSRI
jgi:hypothetical protein